MNSRWNARVYAVAVAASVVAVGAASGLIAAAVSTRAQEPGAVQDVPVPAGAVETIKLTKPRRGSARTAWARLSIAGHAHVKDRYVYDRDAGGLLAIPVIKAALCQGTHLPLDARVLVKLRPGGTLTGCCGVPVLGRDRAPVLWSGWVPLQAGGIHPAEVNERASVPIGEVPPGDYDLSFEVVEPATLADKDAFRDGDLLWRATTYNHQGITVR